MTNLNHIIDYGFFYSCTIMFFYTFLCKFLTLLNHSEQNRESLSALALDFFCPVGPTSWFVTIHHAFLASYFKV